MSPPRKSRQPISAKDIQVSKHADEGYCLSKHRQLPVIHQLVSNVCHVPKNVYGLVFFSCLMTLVCQLGYVSQSVIHSTEPPFRAVERIPRPVFAPTIPTKRHPPHNDRKNLTRTTFSERRFITSLQFTNETTLNFFHLHKTGGTSVKAALQNYYSGKLKANGHKVIVEELCYSRRDFDGISDEATFLRWRCDWIRLESCSMEERNERDIVQGHQFLLHGISDLIPHRTIRTFTILRHPFDRKLSFFFHFFVRAVHRKESEVSWGEVRDFLVYNRVHIGADLGRDAGPNYLAGRMLSDGTVGFVGDYSNGHFEIPNALQDTVAQSAIKTLRTFVFVGIQKHYHANACLLRRTIRAFNVAHGITDLANSHSLDLVRDGLNSGSHDLSAAVAWDRLSDAEKQEFEQREKVDLLIYREAERLFQKQLVLFGCNSLHLQNMSRLPV